MKSFYLFIFATFLSVALATSTIRDEICEERGVAKNIRELARKFQHLSLQQKRKIKEWSSEKTLEDNLAAYNVTDLVNDMHLQQCAIVEIGEGFCSLFVETRNETGYSYNGTTSNSEEIFLGVCECSKINTWRFCSSQLTSERIDECTFEEASNKQENSARVHRRLCDITEMIKWNTCNCSHSINDQILLQTEGFPSCYRAPISQSVCYPRSVCGRSKCTPMRLANNVRSVQCDPACPGGRPFCEHPLFPTSAASVVNSEWSDWEEPECNTTSGEGFLISRATCLDKKSGKRAKDCFGPWKSCCPLMLSPCTCDVRLVEGALIATRTLGPCTILSNDIELKTPQTEPYDLWEYCTDTTLQLETGPSTKPAGEEYGSAKRLGPELVQKMMESLTNSLKLIPGMSSISRKDMTKEEKQPNHDEKQRSSAKPSSKKLWTRQRGSRNRRRKQVAFDRKQHRRRLLWWQKQGGEYEYVDETSLDRGSENVCKRDCLPATSTAETWNEDDEAEMEIPEDGAESTTKSFLDVVAETEGILVTERLQASKAKATPPQAEINDLDEEEAEEDVGQEEQGEEGTDQESQEITDDSDFDFEAISEAPAKSEKSVKHEGAKVKEKRPKAHKVLVEKKKSGKGIGRHKTRLKEPEVLEEEGEEEGDEDPDGKVDQEDEASRTETEETLPDELQMDDDNIDEEDPSKAPKESKHDESSKLPSKEQQIQYVSESCLRQGNRLLITGAVILVLMGAISILNQSL